MVSRMEIAKVLSRWGLSAMRSGVPGTGETRLTLAPRSGWGEPFEMELAFGGEEQLGSVVAWQHAICDALGGREDADAIRLHHLGDEIVALDRLGWRETAFPYRLGYIGTPPPEECRVPIGDTGFGSPHGRAVCLDARGNVLVAGADATATASALAAAVSGAKAVLGERCEVALVGLTGGLEGDASSGQLGG